MLCFVHPSRCLVMCILRGALWCASFEATLVRVLFFGKMSPPFLTSCCPEAVYVERWVLFCWTLIDYLFTTEATRGNFKFFRKRLPPFLRAVVFGGFCSFCCVDRVIDAEGFEGKTSPPFLASMFRSFRGYFDSVRLKSRNPPWRYFGTFRDFSAEGFLVQTFKKPKPLGVLFAHFVTLLPKVFWFGPFWRSKPLGVCFALIVPFVTKVF